MDANALLTMALGLSSAWEVKELVFATESRRLDLRVDCPRGSSFLPLPPSVSALLGESDRCSQDFLVREPETTSRS